MRYVIVQHNCDTVPHPLLIYDADSEYHPGERPKDLFLLLKLTVVEIIFAVSFFNRIPNWTRTLMMTVNQTTGQQQVTSARQALLTPDQE